jgi:hypothetical protein
MVRFNAAGGFPSPRRPAVIIVVGSSRRFKEPLLKCAYDREPAWWTIPVTARKGDRVLFYLTQVDKAIIARGRVASEPWREEDEQDEFYGRYFAEIDELEIFEQPITRAVLMRRFPEWGFWQQPQRACRVKDEYVEALSEFFSLPVKDRLHAFADVAEAAGARRVRG